MSHLVNDLLWLNFRGDDHREPDYGVADFVFLTLSALAIIPLTSPNLFLIEDIAIARNLDVSTQFCHVGRDFSFGADVLLLGIWVHGVDDELWIDHLHIGDKGHQCLSKFIKGFSPLSAIANSTIA